MSTLLERMVQRARAPLSSLEPLSPPLFAESAALRPSLDAAGHTGHSARDAAGVIRTADPAPVPVRQPHPREQAPAPHIDDDAVRVVAPSWPTTAGILTEPPVPRPTSPVGDPDTDDPPPRPRPDQSAPAAAHRRVDAVPAAPPEPTATARPQPDTTPAPTGSAAAPVDLGASGDVAIGGPRAEVDNPARSATPASAEAAAVVTPLLVPARLVPPPSVRDGSPPSGRPAPDTGPDRPEVTVSIGHIEVHAAPPAPPPVPRPPFRPRVSLDDFLGRRQDSVR